MADSNVAETEKHEPFRLVDKGRSSGAVTIEIWDQILASGQINLVSPKDKETIGTYCKDEAGQYYEIRFQEQHKPDLGYTNEKGSPRKTNYANIIVLDADSVKKHFG